MRVPRLRQPGEEADWPFVSDFGKDMAALGINV